MIASVKTSIAILFIVISLLAKSSSIDISFPVIILNSYFLLKGEKYYNAINDVVFIGVYW